LDFDPPLKVQAFPLAAFSLCDEPDIASVDHVVGVQPTAAW
jgi:hypothetical protein